LEKSTGKYIARMDDDDISIPERFEKQTEFLIKNDEYAFVSSNAIVFDGEKETGMNIKPEIPTKKIL
jgi:glycosyltransferase EpsE